MGMSSRELDFAIFCIESVADRLGLAGNAVYDMLARQSDILDRYIIPSYDALHTQGKDYIVDDIIETMRRKGLPV